MNSETIIREQVRKFEQETDFILGRVNGAEEFKDKLHLKLYNLYEDLDKLTFLYALKKSFDTKLEEHNKTCNYKGNGTCPEVLQLSEALFFIEQEIKSLNPEWECDIFI